MYLPNDTLLQGNRYKIVRHISSGGFGNTYEGIHVMMGTRIAIKEFFVKDFCNRDADSHSVCVSNVSKTEFVGKLREKFVAEAKSLFSMRHPNIVKVHDVFEENGTAYYVMDYIEGPSLNDVVKKRGKLPESEALRYIRQVANALQYVHSLNRLHLDVKPANIMIDGKGNAILIDFGTSKHYDDESGENTTTLLSINSKGYAPIEQTTMSFTSFSPATDIYSLGATLYKLLTGVTPPDAQMLIAEEEDVKPLPYNISQSTRAAVASAMQLKRKNRPQSINEFLALLDGEDTLAEGVPPHVKPAVETCLPKKCNKWRIPVMILVAVAIIGVFIFFGLKGCGGGESSEDPTLIQIADTIYYDSHEGSLVYPGGMYKMVYLSGGTFKMGSNSNPQEVTLNSFYIGATEVPQSLWTAVLGDNPSYNKGDSLPVEMVSWKDCQRFISRLNELTGEKFRLPTEAEWEYAARGATNDQGLKYSGSNRIGTVAWYNGNSGGASHPVGTLEPNWVGLYDMSGNVWEWCADKYENPNGAGVQNSENRHITRGGSWKYDESHCQNTSRSNYHDDAGSIDIGLRLAFDSKDE